MRILVLGDLHGRTVWKEIVAKESYEKVIFIGDYFDSHERISVEDQLTNFEKLVKFKQTDPEHVTLLLGNHDYHYLPWVGDAYSGFQPVIRKAVNKQLGALVKSGVLKVAEFQDGVLYTHAGVTTTWAKDHRIDLKNSEQSLDALFDKAPDSFGFLSCGSHNPFGDDKCQSPLWVRPESLLDDALPGIKQVVGHTMQSHLRVEEDIAFIDTLGTSGEFLVVEDGEFEVRVGV